MAIHLRIGKMSDIEDDWIQRYFDYLSKGTAAEGARLVIERTPVVLQCRSCAETYETSAAKIGDIQSLLVVKEAEH